MQVRALLAAGAALTFAALCAHAQSRTIPDNAKRGEMRHLQEMMVEIDGRALQLSAAAQIRDASNRIVVPAALPPWSLVKFVADPEGRVHRVWILTPEEAARPDRRQ